MTNYETFSNHELPPSDHIIYMPLDELATVHLIDNSGRLPEYLGESTMHAIEGGHKETIAAELLRAFEEDNKLPGMRDYPTLLNSSGSRLNWTEAEFGSVVLADESEVVCELSQAHPDLAFELEPERIEELGIMSLDLWEQLDPNERPQYDVMSHQYELTFDDQGKAHLGSENSHYQLGYTDGRRYIPYLTLLHHKHPACAGPETAPVQSEQDKPVVIYRQNTGESSEPWDGILPSDRGIEQYLPFVKPSLDGRVIPRGDKRQTP